MKANIQLAMMLLSSLFITACNEQSSNDPNDASSQNLNEQGSALDQQLRALINQHGLTGDASQGRQLPSINDPLPQLGMQLFFSKSLGGQFDTACVSCHHPALGGADALSLPVGTHAIFDELLGPGREHQDGPPTVPRNAPTTFNVGLWDQGLFHDSRVESLNPQDGSNGSNGNIRTPDSAFGVADPQAGPNLTAAQARLPVTSVEEMRGPNFEAGQDNALVRSHLAARLGDYGIGRDELSRNEWLNEFRNAFASSEAAEDLITFDNIALAIGEYERSQVFVDTAWRDYIQGDLTAIGEAAKRGAVAFYTPAEQGGAHCVQCHSGDFFTDEQHHTIGMPQIGPGTGHGNTDDFGREQATGNANDRYRYRTPSLLNISLTAPYGHAGAYESLEEVIEHYNNPRGTVEGFFDDGGWCQLAQFQGITGCANLYPQARRNSDLALRKLGQERDARTSDFPELDINQEERRDLLAFLNTLTDRCASNRACLSDWIPNRDGGPDDQQLNAVNENGNPL